MTQVCASCRSTFEVSQSDLTYYDTVSPVFHGKKYAFPPPTRCPECRRKLRLMFRNLRKLYKRKCDLTGEQMVSVYAPDSRHKVFGVKEWWGDDWSGLGYGREYDFNRPFFEQFTDLYRNVPVISLYMHSCENCDYVCGAAKCKNCYLSFNLDYCEECQYVEDSMHSRFSYDCLSMNNCELCYECISCDNCYHLLHSIRCTNCSDGFFLYDCRGCKNCIGCANLVNKEYHIFNKKLTPKEYAEKKAELLCPEDMEHTRKQAHTFQLQHPKKYYFGHSNENFTGEGVHHVKNCFECFDGSEMEECKYCHYNYNVHHCMDHTIFGDGSEWIYNCIATGTNCANCSFCFYCWSSSHDNLYCHLVNACSFCFGCTGLKSQQYCILNKEYTKEEYETLVPKIIEHMKSTKEWGEFFPESLSPFAYNETVAHEYFPLSKEEALRKGYGWRADKDKIIGVSKMIPGGKLPLGIADVPNDILNWAIECEATRRPFKLTKQELEFYRDNNLSVPHFHPDERHFRRIALRNPRHLWGRTCDKCGKALRSSYAPDRPETVFCEECYFAAVY